MPPGGADGVSGWERRRRQRRARGRGLYVAGGTVSIANSILSANQALGGNGGRRPPGYGYLGYNGSNGGNGLGGAVYVAAGTVTMTGNNLVRQYRPGRESGGGGGWGSHR